jgi:ATPase subunit of ABC transporter with duplicated ATPase domains
MMPTSQLNWEALPNPFRLTDTNKAITGHVSGRNTDIRNIIIGNQSAIFLTGAPLIGKTTLIRHLNETFQEHCTTSTWSWRDESELAILRQTINLDQRYFVQIDLTSLLHLSQLSDNQNMHRDALANSPARRCNQPDWPQRIARTALLYDATPSRGALFYYAGCNRAFLTKRDPLL